MTILLKEKGLWEIVEGFGGEKSVDEKETREEKRRGGR